MEKHVMASVAVIFFGIIFLSVGAYFIYSEYSAANGWAKETASVGKSEVLKKSYFGDREYRADIDYSYVYGGKEYIGNCCMNFATGDLEYVQRIVSAHPEGSAMEIFVNPENPFESRPAFSLNPFDLFNMAFAGAGLITVIAGLAILKYPGIVH